MIPQISKALSSGFTSQQVMDFLLKQFPQHKDKIKQALSYGFSADQVLQFLSGGQKEVNRNSNLPNTEFAQMREKDIQKTENIDKAGMAAAALGASALAAPVAGQLVSHTLQRALPQSLSGMIGAVSPLLSPDVHTIQSEQQPISAELIQNEPIVSQQPPVNAPSITQAAQNVQPETISNKLNVKDLLSKSGLLNRIEQLKEAGISNEEIGRFVRETQPFEFEKLAKEIGQSPEKMISEYLAETNPQEPMKIEKGATVITPQGVGEVKEIRNGKSIIEIDGKKHQVDEDELESSPIPEKDMGILLDELNKQIEKETGEEVSRAINLVGFSPETRSVIIVYNTGEIYPFDNLDDEDIETATNLQGMRRTSGNNYIGPWVEGTKSPAGSKMHDFVKSLQAKRGKGKEYTTKYKPIYHGHGPAHEKLKEHRKKKK